MLEWIKSASVKKQKKNNCTMAYENWVDIIKNLIQFISNLEPKPLKNIVRIIQILSRFIGAIC